ncbi:MAG TPA: arylsulfatase [Bryobacteraceae bacterium]|nr:arylsulfatase [Bryobacteraceae bacterium]HPT26953.1 arylsulfatase [Bryobacteraceae bacterium]
MQRRRFLQSVAAAGAGPLAAQSGKRPNFVFILADDLGHGDLGCYGQSRIATPYLDALAKSGTRYTQAYSGSTVCAPSRCCLMTGKHAGHATVRGNKKPEVGLLKDEPTVASLLKGAGYRTGLFGKWGLGGPGTSSVPNDHGFDQFYGFLDQLHAHNSFTEHLWDNRHETFLTENWFNARKTFANDKFTERALKFIGAQSPADPFFLYLPYTIPHANNERGRIDENGIDVPDLGIYKDKPWPEVERAFAASITRMDTQIGEVVRTLAARGLIDNTLIIFSSDNGPHAEGNHRATYFESSGAVRGMKRDLYEGGIRVPAIVNWRGRTQGGRVSDAPWAFWDILPTFCAMAGAKAPAGIDGIDIRPTLLEGRAVARDHFYWEFHEGGFAQAVRQGDWKLVRQKPKFDLELFRLSDDPRELRNLAGQYPDVAKRMSTLFKSARTDNANWPV